MTIHVEDGVLVRYLDGEDAPAERAEVAQHVEGCDRCAGRLAELTRAGETLSAALRAADVPVPRRHASPRWRLRAAAAVLMLAGIAGVVRPVRAWILERAGALWVAVTGQAAAGPIVGPVRSASVTFVPVGDEFTLEVVAGQARGTLRLETAAGDSAEARIEGGAGTEDLVVLPSRLRIVNRTGSAASYVIRVPARVARVRVVVGEEPPWDYYPGSPAVELAFANR